MSRFYLGQQFYTALQCIPSLLKKERTLSLINRISKDVEFDELFSTLCLSGDAKAWIHLVKLAQGRHSALLAFSCSSH